MMQKLHLFKYYTNRPCKHQRQTWSVFCLIITLLRLPIHQKWTMLIRLRLLVCIPTRENVRLLVFLRHTEAHRARTRASVK